MTEPIEEPLDEDLEQEPDEELEGEEEDEEVSFIPFHALNEFMTGQYRQEVIRSTLQALPGLPEKFRIPVETGIRQTVRVPGFRNSAKAPAAVKAKFTIDAFEKSPALVSAVISAWAEAHADLRQQVYDLLVERGWELLPPEADRTQLPGFLITWPDGQDFDVLNAVYAGKHPGSPASTDDVSLMAVWLSGRLPYHVEGDDEEDEEAEENRE